MSTILSIFLIEYGSCMQKIFAFIFLLTFSSMQYGKLISYWNCMITNGTDLRAVDCDCEKILSNQNGIEDQSQSSKMNIKDKTEEWLTFYSVRVISVNYFQLCNRVLPFNSIQPVAYYGSIFQPPKIS